jgi:dipeptidase E
MIDMAKLFLTSCGFYTESIKQQFLELLDGDITHVKAAIITTASQHKDRNKYAIKAREDLLDMGSDLVDFIDIEYVNPSRLNNYNMIYINGGNPFYLLYHIKKSGADFILKQLAKQNTVFLGVSAGSLILCPTIDIVQYFTPHLNSGSLQNLTGLKITEKRVFPHYDREDLFPDALGQTIEQRLSVYEASHKCSVIRLKDNEALSIEM